MSSLEDRISKPETGDNASKASTTSDEANSAVEASSASAAIKAKAEKEMSTLTKAQIDGASEPVNGNTGVIEPSYDVDVKLSDMQANPNDPLYSVKSFEELGL